MKRLIAYLSVFVAVHSFGQKNKLTYQNLAEYNGKYEYTSPSSLILSASDFDTTLYAIIDEAKYRLSYKEKDIFENNSKTQVIFQRDEHGKVISYTYEGKAFKRLTTEIEKYDWFPRKELYNREDNYKYQIPKQLNDGLTTGDLNKSFSKPDLILAMVKETIKGGFPDVHSILIWKDGHLVLEEYFYDYNIDKPHQLRSASKSFVGTLVGIAIDQKKIKSENELLLPLFNKEYKKIENMDSRKNKITIKDFLTYRHGMDCNDDDPKTAGNELKMYEHTDWIKFVLDLPMIQEPGVKSSYCTGCAQTLGRLVEIATSTPLVEFADKNLFSPMGITNYKWRFKPDTSSVATFNQMYLRPRDILKLALMHKDKGKWSDKRIVSSDWIKKTFEKDDVEFGYLWRHKSFDIDGKSYNSYLATGNGGQKINIWPELNMITIFTGGNYNSFLYGRPTPPNEMIPKYILKGL